VKTEHVPEKPMIASFKCDPDHGNYLLGVVYKQETYAKYCKLGCYLFAVNFFLAENNLWKFSVLRVMLLLLTGPVKRLHFTPASITLRGAGMQFVEYAFYCRNDNN